MSPSIPARSSTQWRPDRLKAILEHLGFSFSQLDGMASRGVKPFNVPADLQPHIRQHLDQAGITDPDLATAIAEAERRYNSLLRRASPPAWRTRRLTREVDTLSCVQATADSDVAARPSLVA